jgi:DNA polymerase I-like protein with 3'-5' exonuclease and polymerase domains
MTTATGRFSSCHPNLQNLPGQPITLSSSELINFKDCIIPRSSGGMFVSADYCQIEVRLLALFSQDQKLCRLFSHNNDIYRLMASEIFRISVEAVSEELRQQCKQLTLAILYGMVMNGLESI